MNAITAHAPHQAARNDDATRARRRRRTVVASIAAAFLGAYVLGVSWFANELGTEMERNLQGAPAIEDVQHRG